MFVMYYIMCSKPRAGLSDCDCLFFNDSMGSMSHFLFHPKGKIHEKRCFENMPDSSQAQSNNGPLNRGVISFRGSQNK